MSNKRQYVLSVMAANRVGILAALSNALDELGGNLHELNQAVMGRYFAIILAAEFPYERDAEVIVEHIRAVCGPFGAEIALKAMEDDDDAVDLPDNLPRQYYLLAVSGEDRPGILRLIAHRLAQQGIDVVDLHGARSADEATFAAWMELAVPQGVDIMQLFYDLQSQTASSNVVFTLQHRDVLTAISHPEPFRAGAATPGLGASNGHAHGGNSHGATGHNGSAAPGSIGSGVYSGGPFHRTS